MTPRMLLLTLVLVASPVKSLINSFVNSEATTVVKERNLQRNLVDDQVRIMFCTACGYEQNFHQVKIYLEDTFPHLVDRVYGANYEADSFKMMLARILGYAQMVAIPLLLFGDYLLPSLGVVNVSMLRWARENRIVAIFIVVAMGALASSLTASGAF
ncbi:putative selenoprotein, Rdx-type [Plasmopara halstedii]